MIIEDWFGLFIRILGVVVLIYGLSGVMNAFLFHLGYFEVPAGSVGYYLIDGLFYSFAGLYLIRGANSLVDFAFPQRYRDEEIDDEEVAPEDAKAE